MDWHGLNWLDTSIALVLITSGLVALFTGLLRELVSIGSLSIALYLSSRAYGPVASIVGRWIDRPDLVALSAFLGLLIAIWTIAGSIGLFIVGFLPKGGVSLPSRIVGSFFGVVKGLALAIVVLMLLTVYLPEENPALQESRIYPVLIPGARLFAQLLPIEERLILLRRIEPEPAAPPQWIEGFV